jgi:hypothetical protein
VNGRRYWDPDGVRFGVPTWPWRLAPAGLATRRQLAAAGLRPGGQPVAGQVVWLSRRRVPAGRPPAERFALLYRIELAAPRREPSVAQLVALAKADQARRTCRTCGRVRGYVIPRRLGECLDCAPDYTAAAGGGAENAVAGSGAGVVSVGRAA